MIEIKDNVILRDGEAIGNLDGDNVICPRPIHHKVKSAVESIAGRKLQFVDSQTGADEPEVADIPEAPPTDYRGDKTPAYVEWFRDNHSEEEFKRKYAGRKLE